MEGDLHELNGKPDFSERRNNVADLLYSMPVEECDSLERQSAIGGECSGSLLQRRANASKDVDASINKLNGRAARAQKAIRDAFQNNSVALGQRFQTFF